VTWLILIVAVLTLVAAVVGARIAYLERVANQASRRAAGTTEFERQSTAIYDNPNAPHGIQMELTFHSTGPGVAYTVTAWLAKPDGSPFAPRVETKDVVNPGQPYQRRFDFPAPRGTPIHVWIGWRDANGPQSRNTGPLEEWP